MSRKGDIIGGIIGIGAAAGAVIFITSKSTAVSPPSGGGGSGSSVLSSIKLSASSTSIKAGATVQFTATAYDQNNNPLSGQTLILFDEQTSSNSSMGATNSSGQDIIGATFNNAGTYKLYAESQNSSIKSNVVSISVSIPSCLPCQTYDTVLQQCTDLTPSVIDIVQPTVPTAFMQVGLNATILAHNQWACWIAPAKGGTCPTFTFGGSPSCLSGDLFMVKLTGSVSDSNGNKVPDTGQCQKYKVYFGLNPASVQYQFQSNINELFFTAHNDWTVQLDFGFYDASGNSLDYVYADANGNFTVYVGITVKLLSTTGYNSGGNITAPIKTPVITVNVGFDPGVWVNSIAASFNLQTCMYGVA